MRSLACVSSLSLALGAGAVACSSEEAEPEREFEPWTLEDLTAEQGFSLRIPPQTLEPGQEFQQCYFVAVPDLDGGKPIWIDRVHLAINPGSHHMNVFRVKTLFDMRPEHGEAVKLGAYDATVVRGDQTNYASACWTSSNWSDWPLVANSQNSKPSDPYTDWRLPEGVAIKLMPGELLMLQPHFVNTTTQKTPFGMKAGINFHKFEAAGAPMELGTLFATQQSIRICQSNPKPSFSGTCRLPEGQLTITAANGHFHSRGRRFSVFTWDGTSITSPPENQRFYTSTHWDDPPMARDLDVKPPQKGGVWWTCEYQWVEPKIGCDAVNARDKQHAGDCCYTFGAGVDTQEHCNLFLYYYPRVGNTDVFCN